MERLKEKPGGRLKKSDCHHPEASGRSRFSLKTTGCRVRLPARSHFGKGRPGMTLLSSMTIEINLYFPTGTGGGPSGM